MVFSGAVDPILISMGSNIEPERHLAEALRRLRQEVDVIGVSRVFETEPVDSSGGPWFLNAAVMIETRKTPSELKFEVLRVVEEGLGRVRDTDRNAPRTIDLDISLFGDLVFEDPQGGIDIPDPEIVTRAHVALPLADLAPDARHPENGETLGEIASRFAGCSGIRTRRDLDLATPGAPTRPGEVPGK